MTVFLSTRLLSLPYDKVLPVECIIDPGRKQEERLALDVNRYISRYGKSKFSGY